ncbi:MAG: pitrilysin family protein [Myxococcota bacterium]
MPTWWAVGWLATPAIAQEPSLSLEQYTLDNGLRVVLVPDRSAPLVAVDVWYHVGSRDEEPGRTGFAHLFEHLMFQGSPSQPDDYIAPIEQAGGTVNGSTNADRTNYYEVVPREALPVALFLEADRMGGLLEVLDQAKLDNQREVVRNERRQRIENVPYGDARILIAQNLYPEGHGYHHPTIGSHADLEAADVDDVSAFFRRWYVPNNAVLTVVGDFDPAQARAWIQADFGPIPRGPEAVSIAPPPPRLPYDVTVRQYRPVPLRKVWLAWHAPAAGTQADAELDLLASVLGNGRDGRLVRELVERRGIAQDLTVSQQSASWSSQLVIAATAAPGHTTAELVAGIDEVLGAVLGGAAAPTADELGAVTAQFELGYWSSLEPVLGRAEGVQRCVRLTGGPDCLVADLDRYRVATPASVVATGRAWLEAPRVELHLLPEKIPLPSPGPPRAVPRRGTKPAPVEPGPTPAGPTPAGPTPDGPTPDGSTAAGGNP